jgi:hypothetical protein
VFVKRPASSGMPGRARIIILRVKINTQAHSSAARPSPNTTNHSLTQTVGVDFKDKWY